MSVSVNIETNTLTTDNWHHVALSYSDSKTRVNIYVDGINKYSQSDVSIEDNVVDVVASFNIVGASNVNGKIDNINAFAPQHNAQVIVKATNVVVQPHQMN
jgi:hypothetical protein